MRLIYLLLLSCMFCRFALAQSIDVSGKITDDNGNGIGFVSVWIAAMHTGAISNEAGIYQVKLNSGQQHLTFRSPGYLPVDTIVNIDTLQRVFNIRLKALHFAEAPGAENIIALAIANRRMYLHDTTVYLGTLYSKGTQILDKAPKMFLKKDIAAKLHLTEERRGIISLNESVSSIRYRSPSKMREYMAAVKTTTNDNLFNFNSAPDFQVNFYYNKLHWDGLCDHSFVSPIAGNAFAFYRYQLNGRFADGKDTIAVIRVIPRHHSQYTFSGNIYIMQNSGRLYAADLVLNSNARIDFISEVHIRQQYVPLHHNEWEAQLLTFGYKGSLLGYHNIGYYLQAYTNLKADTAELKYALFTGEVYHSNTEVYKNNEVLQKERPAPLLPDEVVYYGWNIGTEKHQKDKTLADSLQNTSNKFKLIDYLFNGYTLRNYKRNSLWNLPSPRSFIFYNTVEGWGLDLNPVYTKLFDRQRSLTISPHGWYSLSNKTFATNVYFNYRYNPFRQSQFYGGLGVDFLDLNNTGTITPFLNSLSTLLLGNNYLKLYQSRFVMLGATGEIMNGILLNGQLEYANRRSLFNTSLHTFNKDSVMLTSNNPLNPFADTPLFPEYRAFIFQGSVTFTFAQEYKITPAGKFIQPNPYPRLRINARKGLKKFGSDVDYSVISADIFQDRVNMGILGYTGYYLSAGKFLNTNSLYYPDFYQFRGGQSFFFDATLGSFHFLNFYTYSTYKTYFEAHLEHNFTGYFLSRIPLLKKLHLQEIVGGSYLTQGTLPAYKEFYFGIKQRVFRLDYGMAFGKFTERIHGLRLIYNF